VDVGLQVLMGQNSLLLLADPNEYPPWIPHFSNLGVCDLNDTRLLVGIAHHYSTFCELALLEAATANSYLRLYARLAERRKLDIRKFHEIKLAVSCELESLRNHPTNLPHGLRVIERVQKQLDTMEILERLSRQRDLLEDVSSHRAQGARERLLTAINIVLLSSLGLQIANLVVQYLGIDHTHRTWVIAQGLGASIGLLVLLIVFAPRCIMLLMELRIVFLRFIVLTNLNLKPAGRSLYKRSAYRVCKLRSVARMMGTIVKSALKTCIGWSRGRCRVLINKATWILRYLQ
jgi:hypothetical protein